jgi:hypothetical protein
MFGWVLVIATLATLAVDPVDDSVDDSEAPELSSGGTVAAVLVIGVDILGKGRAGL